MKINATLNRIVPLVLVSGIIVIAGLIGANNASRSPFRRTNTAQRSSPPRVSFEPLKHGILIRHDMMDTLVSETEVTLSESYHSITLEHGMIIGQTGSSKRILGRNGQPLTSSFQEFSIENNRVIGYLGREETDLGSVNEYEL
jgi:hypothetical protein